MKITITNTDYEEVVSSDGNSVFIFLDPPYFSARKSALYGRNGNLHRSFNHERFASVMKKYNHKRLITYNEDGYIRKLFSFSNIFPWNSTYGMRSINCNGSSQIGREVFISNYLTSLPQQDDFDFSA